MRTSHLCFVFEPLGKSAACPVGQRAVLNGSVVEIEAGLAQVLMNDKRGRLFGPAQQDVERVIDVALNKTLSLESGLRRLTQSLRSALNAATTPPSALSLAGFRGRVAWRVVCIIRC